MGLDDLLIKKYLKKYLTNVLNKILIEPKKPLTTKAQIIEYLVIIAEELYEKLVLEKKG